MRGHSAAGGGFALDLFEKQIGSEEKYKGIIVRVRLDEAELHTGKHVRREVVEHPGGVGVLPVDETGTCTLVRQFRYPFSETLLEIPAGKLEYGEDPYEAAVRELSEETGLTADRMVDLGPCYTSPGFSTEVLHLYLALGLHQGKSHPDQDEFLNVEKLPLDELIDKVMSSEIADAKTIIAALKAGEYLNRNRK